jgi:hypothetical protein
VESLIPSKKGDFDRKKATLYLSLHAQEKLESYAENYCPQLIMRLNFM